MIGSYSWLGNAVHVHARMQMLRFGKMDEVKKIFIFDLLISLTLYE